VRKIVRFVKMQVIFDQKGRAKPGYQATVIDIAQILIWAAVG
jgi:hypothetical protein